MADLDPDSPIPLFRQLAQKLAADISDGTYTRRLPTERELMDEHGVGRETVRRAISLLAAEGIVEVSHGRGTFVIRKPPAGQA